ncbi:MAG: ABC transporter substrate-binding protein [Nitrososphaerales archaeon]
MVKSDGKRSGVSNVIAAVLLVIGLIIGGAAVYAVTSTSTTATTSSTSSLSGTVNIGVLDDLTDGLSGEGLKINYTVHQAVNDINAYIQTTSLAGKVTFNVLVEDYALDNTKAQSIFNTFKSDGISAVVGPLNSGAAQALLTGYADADQIVMISPSSTSAALAIPNDYLFRTAPTDVTQGKADSAMMWQNGVKAIIQVFRQDTYGSGLANYTQADFTALGGKVVAQIPYDTTTTNFATTLSTLNSDWQSAVTQYGANSTAIQIIAFDEGATLLQQASTSYPSLIHTAQPWYGTDGVEGESAFTNSTIASTMQAVRLPATVFGFTNSTKTQALCVKLFAATSQTCDSYPLGAYDDMWIAALSLIACGKNSGSCVQSILPKVADNYYGVTGWTALDANGDRATSDFLIYCITGPANNLAWTVCGSWSFQSNVVTWTNKPAT